ncbi:22865_t:CDS:2, partial [Racocetra persica]
PTEFSLSANDNCYFTGLPSLVEPLPKCSKIKPVHSYSSSYFHHLSKNKFTDLVIEVGEEPDIERFNAHTEILSNSTPYFKCALSSSWAKFENDKIIFKKPNITPKVFLIALNYIYSGEVLWKQHVEKDILNFLVATEELLIDGILDEGQCHLIEQRYEWILCNLDLVTFTSFRYKSLEILQDYCLEKICENPRLLFRSKYFLQLDGSLWMKFLNMDKIQMEEFEIWHNLILWGIGQISGTNNYFFSFSKEELANLKNILYSYIPLIRFTKFSVNQLYTFVWPFRDIIDLNLRNEIADFQNNLKLQLNVILEPRQPNDPESWDYIDSSRKYLYTNESFIFSFDPCKNSQNIKFSTVKENNPAIKDDLQLGPCFGKQDIHMTDDFNKRGKCTSHSSSFENIILAKNFSIIEYEVFQVVYKRNNENRWISFMNPKYFKND